MKTTPAEERVGRVGQRRQMVIPRVAGDLVTFAEQKNGVLIKPCDDTLSREETRIVCRGEAQLKRGHSKSWRAVKHALPR